MEKEKKERVKGRRRKAGEGRERRTMFWPLDQGFTLRAEKQEPKEVTYHPDFPVAIKTSFSLASQGVL